MALEIIIKWEGPFSSKEIRTKNDTSDYGVYQVYGNHRIYGSNVLLYIGKAVGQCFAVRLPQHNWFEWEDNQQTYFLGKLYGVEQPQVELWDAQIDLAETYIIDYCQPAWNSKSLNVNIDNYESANIYNFGHMGSLPRFIPNSPQLQPKNWNDDYVLFRANWNS